MLDTLAKLSRGASSFLLYLGAIGLVVMTVIVGWQVFGRYVLGSSPSWSEQAALTLMIWYVFFAAAAGVREGFHIRILALQNASPEPLRKMLRIAADIAVALCGAAMAIWGAELVSETWSHVIPTLGLPRGVAYLPLPVSGVLIVLFALERVLETAAGKAEPEEDSRWS